MGSKTETWALLLVDWSQVACVQSNPGGTGAGEPAGGEREAAGKRLS